MRSFPVLVATLLATTAPHAALAADENAPQGKDAARDVASPAPARKTFSTGVAKGRDLLDQAISASVIDEKDLAKLSQTSVAGVISNIPGISSETSGIDGFSAISVRGLPLAADGAKYMQMQEDGLPVLEFGDVRFSSTDQFLRTDLSLSQVQAIRGGSASTFASNSPGGVVNLLSKTGETEGGTLQFSSGLDHDLNRVDFEYGSPVGSNWRFHVGGFFHEGEGPRKIGYAGFRGGQIKVNVTRTFAGGYIRFYGKFLDDRQPDYAFYPLAISGSNEQPVLGALPGTDPLKSTFFPGYTPTFGQVDESNRVTTINGRNGLRGKSKSFGLEAQFEVAGWTITDRFRYSANSGEYNYVFPYLSSSAAVVTGLLGATGGTLAYADGPLKGQLITSPNTINGNGVFALVGRLNTKLNNMNFAVNDLRASRTWDVGGGKLTTTAGVYASSQNIGLFTTLASDTVAIGAPGDNQLIDVTNAAGTKLSEGGIFAYGVGVLQPLFTRHDLQDMSYRILAPFGSLNYQIGKLAVGASVRFDNGKVSGTTNTASFGGGRVGQATIDINGNGTISVPETKVAILPIGREVNPRYNYDYVSYSLSANYRLAESASVFGRYSKGARAAAERALVAGSLNTTTGTLNDPATAFGYVKQAEVGLKFRQANASAYITGFWASTAERNVQLVFNAQNQAALTTIVRGYDAKGIEFEGDIRHGPFYLAVGATWTKAKIANDAANPALAGNRPRHNSQWQFQARPEVDFGKVAFGAAVNGRTSSFAQDTNLLKQPGYVIVSPFVQVRPTDRIQLSLNAFNVFDKLAVVFLNASTLPANGVANAQYLNGRTLTGSLRFSF